MSTLANLMRVGDITTRSRDVLVLATATQCRCLWCDVVPRRPPFVPKAYLTQKEQQRAVGIAAGNWALPLLRQCRVRLAPPSQTYSVWTKIDKHPKVSLKWNRLHRKGDLAKKVKPISCGLLWGNPPRTEASLKTWRKNLNAVRIKTLRGKTETVDLTWVW